MLRRLWSLRSAAVADMADGWHQVALEETTSRIRSEIATIREADGVKVDSITAWTAERAQLPGPGTFQIRFDIAPPGLQDPLLRLHDPEPIILAWDKAEGVGRQAPSVFSGRSDFPRDLPHLNPVPNVWPVCLCLSLAGNSAIYQRFGIRGILERLRTWLLDAAAGTLNADGWHPVPLAHRLQDRTVGAVIMDPAVFQERAATGNVDGFSAGLARSWGTTVHVAPEEFCPIGRGTNHSPLARNYLSRIEEERKSGHRCDIIPWVLVYQDTSTSSPVFNYVENLGTLLKRLEKVHLDEKVARAIPEVEKGGVTGRRAKVWDKAVLIVVALRRPDVLIPSMQGLASNPNARSFELATYLAIAPTEKPLFDPDNRVIQCAPVGLPDAGMFRHMAGTPLFAGIAMVGAGALGSALLDQLVRAGAHDIVVMDCDHIEAHNLARHAARFEDIGNDKATWAERHLSSIGISAKGEPPDMPGALNRLSIRSRVLDVEIATDEDLGQCLLTAAVVLDATANPQVRTRLCASTVHRRQVRAELFDRGRLGVLAVGAATGNPDPFDLYFWLCMLHHPDRDDAVREWLDGERSGSLGLEDVVVGFGCASATVKLPKWAIDQHAASIMPTLADVLRADNPFTGAGIGINPLDVSMRPRGWRWYEAPSFKEFRLGEFDWLLRIDPAVLDELQSLRIANLPNETGGYLFGGWDHFAKRLTVVAATPAPAGSRGTPSDLDLAGIEHCKRARALIRRTAGRLHLVGTWHSHPDGCSMPSPKDFLTISAMAIENTARGIPTLMLIQSDRDELAIAFSPG